MKITRKTTEIPNLLCMCGITGNEYVLSSISDGSKETTWVWKLVQRLDEVKTWVKDNVKIVKSCDSPIFGWCLKRGLTPDVNLWRQNQQTSMLKLQQKTRRKIQCLSLLYSPSWPIVSLHPANIGDSVFILFLSPDDYSKSVEANKLFC